MELLTTFMFTMLVHLAELPQITGLRDVEDRATVQAVSCRLATAMARVRPTSDHVGWSMVTEVEFERMWA
jgi:hypothetical protein